MKLYYLEHDLYPATYNFKDEADGTSGTDITGIDTEGSNDSTYSAVIIAVEGGHRKVIQFDASGDNAAETYWIRNFADQTGISNIELLIKYIDLGQGSIDLRLKDSGGNIAVLLRINCTDNKLYVYHAAINTSVAMASDTWTHIRIKTDTATDHQWIWVNGTALISDVVFRNSIVIAEIATLELFLMNGGGVNALKCYIDAIGEDWDTDYNIGDNREVDWHDPYNKERITDIVEYPIITPRLNTYCQCNAILGDFEGAKFDDWYARDFNKILIEDDSGNIIFRGFLIKKIFTKKDLTLYLAGIGALLDWKHFGDQGNINYILAEGLVAAPIPATSILTVKDNDGNPMGWAADYWIKEGMDVGILIVDKTDVNTRTWDSSAISQEGGTVIAGNNASTTTFMDDDYYNVKESTITPDNPITIITPVIDNGVAVDDTDFLKSIQIEYNFRMKIVAGILARNWGRVYLEILKGENDWQPIANVGAVRYAGSHTTGWCMGIPTSVEGGNGNEHIIEDTDAELQKYFTKVGATYDKLKGLRFKTTGDLKSNSYFYIHVDFINVVVGYTSDDISPIMESITDNAGSTITALNVSAWDETGVVENDGFKIGQNTGVIIQDIAKETGLDVQYIGDTTETGIILRPNGDDIIDWETPAAGTHYTCIDEEVTYPTAGETADLIEADDTDDAETEIFDMTTDDIGTDIIKSIKLWIYGRKNIDNNPIGSIYLDGWLPNKDFSLTLDTNEWASVEWTGLKKTQADLDGMQIRFTAPDILINGYNRVYTAYVEITSFTKKYMAREFKGSYCMEPLKAVSKLEGFYWYEDYENDQIILLKSWNFADSAVDLTEADYDGPWEYEDDCNQVRSFFVFGKAEDNIFAKAVDETVKGYISKQLIDESITNVADAQEIADAQLALVNNKRPSIKLPLTVDNVALQLGTTVDVTFARPTIAKAAYTIRKLERKKRGINDIALTIWVGLGESTIEENVAKFIRDNMFRSHKSLTDRLISP